MDMHMKAYSRTKRRMEQHRLKPKNGMHKDCSRTKKRKGFKSNRKLEALS